VTKIPIRSSVRTSSKYLCEGLMFCGVMDCNHRKFHYLKTFTMLPDDEATRSCVTYPCKRLNDVFEKTYCIEVEVDDEDKSSTKDMENQDSSSQT